MLRINKLTDYGIVVMTHLAGRPGEVFSTQGLASATRVPAPTVAKLMQELQKAGLVEARRGACGGYGLVRDPGSITVVDLIEALEGPIGLTDCASSDHACAVESCCNVKGHWAIIHQAVKTALSAVTLRHLAGQPGALSVLTSGSPDEPGLLTLEPRE